MRRTILLAGVLLSVVALGSDSPKEYEDRTEVSIEGTWQRTQIEFNGEKSKPQSQFVMTLRSGTYAGNNSNGDKIRGSCRIDTAPNPPHLDYTLSSGAFEGQTIKCIYQIDGDRLRIAHFVLLAGNSPRPQGFNDDALFVITYKRVK